MLRVLTGSLKSLVRVLPLARYCNIDPLQRKRFVYSLNTYITYFILGKTLKDTYVTSEMLLYKIYELNNKLNPL